VREEIENFWRQAQADLKNARLTLDGCAHYLCAFLCQQAAEKALKALHMLKKRSLPHTHNIIQMAEALGAPERLLSFTREMNPDYVQTRYPDAANGVPADNYDERIAKSRLSHAEEIVEWVRKQIA